MVVVGMNEFGMWVEASRCYEQQLKVLVYMSYFGLWAIVYGSYE